MKIEYAVALFPMMGYRMAQESSQYHLRFRTYAGRKNSLLLLLLKTSYYDDEKTYYDDDDDERPDSFYFF